MRYLWGEGRRYDGSAADQAPLVTDMLPGRQAQGRDAKLARSCKENSLSGWGVMGLQICQRIKMFLPTKIQTLEIKSFIARWEVGRYCDEYNIMLDR